MKKKNSPVKGKRKENQDTVLESAEPPVKINKEARQKAAETRKENKKKNEKEENTLNEAARELDALLASVPTQLPSYEETMMVVEQIPPPQGPVKLAEGIVHQQDVGVPLEPVTATATWPAPESVPPPPLSPPLSSSSRSSPPLIQPSGDVLCPFHKTPLTAGLSKNGVPYMYCQDFDAVSFLGHGCRSSTNLDRC